MYKENFELRFDYVMDANNELAKHSAIANDLIGKKFAVVTMLYNDDVTTTDSTTIGNGIGFHPNGRSGCIFMNDEFLYGIRCNHLMWMDGYFEGSFNPGLLLIGNHKGDLVIKAIIFERSQEQ